MRLILCTVLLATVTPSVLFAQSDEALAIYQKNFENIIYYSTDPMPKKMAQIKAEVPASFFEKRGYYALVKAVETRDETFIDFILAQPGVSINMTQPSTNESILRYLPRDNYQEVIPGTCTMTDKLVETRKKLLNFLLSRGAKLDHIDANGGNVMLNAVYAKDLDFLKYLYELNGRKFIQVPENNLLYLASYIGCVDITKWLVEQGMDVNMPNKYEGSAIAAAARRPEIIQYLISKGANVNTTNSGGWTPLMYAVNYNNAESVRLLLAVGADVSAKNVRGWDVFQVAKEYKASKEVVKLLKEASK